MVLPRNDGPTHSSVSLWEASTSAKAFLTCTETNLGGRLTALETVAREGSHELGNFWLKYLVTNDRVAVRVRSSLAAHALLGVHI